MTFSHPTLLAAIHKACPELMELSTGCLVKQVDTYMVIGKNPRHSLMLHDIKTGEIIDSVLVGANWTILGHEPQLAHVLRAIEQFVGSKKVYWTVDTTGNIFGVEELDPVELNNFPAVDHFIKHIPGANWNLTLGLYGQDTATLDFLESVLVTK